jgi:hypothetical protein
MEKVLPFLSGAVGIGAEEGTEMGLRGSDLLRVYGLGSDHRFELLIEGVNRKVVGAWILYLVGDDGVVAFFPVRSVELLRPVDFHTILKAVLVSNVAINDKFGWVVPDDVEMGSQEICKKTAPTCV